MKRLKKAFAIISFQVGVNIIGIPLFVNHLFEYTTQCAVVIGSKFHR